jgi:hypothetical protein
MIKNYDKLKVLAEPCESHASVHMWEWTVNSIHVRLLKVKASGRRHRYIKC